MIEILLECRRGDFDLRCDLRCAARALGIWGPSGAGKSTVLQGIAGLLTAQRARVAIQGTVLEDSKTGFRMPQQQRRIGMVFQQGLLFPHYRVLGNLRYGFDLLPVAERRIGLDDCISLLQLDPLLERPVTKLSGGERQRVALGRALLTSPRLLLCDEPLSSLNAELKAEIIPYLVRLRDTLHLPMIYVTHDRQELDQVCDRIVEMRNGTVIDA